MYANSDNGFRNALLIEGVSLFCDLTPNAYL